MRIANLQIALLALLGAATLAPAQTKVVIQADQAPVTAASDYKPTLTFDIVSVRESAVGNNGPSRVAVKSLPHSSVFEASSFPLKSLLQVAYGFGTPIAGEPSWVNDTYYDVKAKSDPSMDAQMAKMTDDQSKLEKMHMLQVMLAERFNLKAHLETRDTSVLAMLPAKGGIKLQPVKATEDNPTPATQGGDVQTHGGPQGLEFVAKTFSPTGITALLSSQVEAPIIDRTGLTGYFNFTLQFGREWSARNPDSWPDIYTAVQEQLGLKLEHTHAAVPVLVIDHIDKANAN